MMLNKDYSNNDKKVTCVTYSNITFSPVACQLRCSSSVPPQERATSLHFNHIQAGGLKEASTVCTFVSFSESLLVSLCFW